MQTCVPSRSARVHGVVRGWRIGKGGRYGERVRCPFCGSTEVKVVDSRTAEGGSAIRRRRECEECTKRFTTFERVEELTLMIVKRSGARVPFERAKVADGIRRAAKNRPISEETIGAMVRSVETQLRHEGAEVASEVVGRAVLEQLRPVDEVAYVRFASVYKGFADAGDFEREIGLLQKTTSPKPPRTGLEN